MSIISSLGTGTGTTDRHLTPHVTLRQTSASYRRGRCELLITEIHDFREVLCRLNGKSIKHPASAICLERVHVETGECGAV